MKINSIKKVLIINIGWEQSPLIDILFERGYELYGITSNPEYIQSIKFKSVFISSYRDLEAIYKIALEVIPDAVISDQCDYSHFAQAYLSNRLNLNGPTIKQAQISINKYIQRNLAKEMGVLVPDFKLILNLNDAINAANQIGFPLIIKPIDNRGSFGVSKVHNIEELENAYYAALVNSHSRYVLIEKFISGYEITIDGYCFNGVPKSLSLALKNKEGLLSQVSMDIKYPGEIPDDIYKHAINNNEFVAKSLGYTFGMIHSEYIIDDENKIYLVESANRGGGVFTSEIIVPKVSGINILERYIDDILGKTSSITLPETPERNNVILKFFSFESGLVKNIKGQNEVKNAAGVLAFRLNFNIGDEIKNIENDGNRHGFIIFHSNNDIRKEISELIKLIHIEYEK